MDQEELLEILHAHEWRDKEYKEARTDVPHDAYETVSAFANTDGGYLVFGVKKNGKDFDAVGVLNVDKVQGDFLTTLRQPNKISVIINVQEELHTYNGSDLIIFYIPEVHRSEKPVFVNGDIRRSFIRKGGSDIRCSDDERNRFLMDAATERYDGHSIDLDIATAFDPESIKWYRAVYEKRPGNPSCESLSDLEFLSEMGMLVGSQERRLPCRAAILLFGNNASFRQLLPRPVVDCQRFSLTRGNADAGERWDDRMVLDENLIRIWPSLIEWYQRSAEHPFRVDPASLQRDDTPPDYRAFREAIINLLIHQDYSDHLRNAEFKQYRDQTVFRNPGDAFEGGIDLLETRPREVRNPRIVTMFRRIGLSENAGWGLRDVYKNWQKLGHVPPRISNDKSRKSFELVLKKEELLSEPQILFQLSLGVNLSDEQARAFAFVCREKQVTLSELEAVTGLAGTDAMALAESLVTQMLLKSLEAGKLYSLADHLRERFEVSGKASEQPVVKKADLVTAQVGPATPDLSTAQVKPLEKLTETQWKIVEFCDLPRRLTEIMGHLGLTNRGYFKKQHLDPLLRSSIVAMTNPGNPKASNQRYVLTETGVKLKVRRISKNARRSEER